jgi:hypothetical protein
MAELVRAFVLVAAVDGFNIGPNLVFDPELSLLLRNLSSISRFSVLIRDSDFFIRVYCCC